MEMYECIEKTTENCKEPMEGQELMIFKGMSGNILKKCPYCRSRVIEIKDEGQHD